MRRDLGSALSGLPSLWLSAAVALSFLIGPSGHPLAEELAYAIDWYSVDGGGGTQTGGVYEAQSTVGQPDSVSGLTSVSYVVSGGFWTVHAVQIPDAPLLSIAAAGSQQVVVSWGPAAPGWVLQESSTFPSTNWMTAPSLSTNPITVTVIGPLKFYRLYKP